MLLNAVAYRVFFRPLPSLLSVHTKNYRFRLWLSLSQNGLFPKQFQCSLSDGLAFLPRSQTVTGNRSCILRIVIFYTPLSANP